MRNTILLQFVNLTFGFIPLTRGYRLKSKLLKIAGVACDLTCRIVSSARIITVNIEIGEDTFIGHQVLITGNSQYKIKIGANVDIAPRVCILSGSHVIDMIGNHSAGEGSGGDVIIEDGAWVGASTTVLPGTRIGKKSIIGAGSLVVKDIPPYCIAVGNPCKPIKMWNFETQVFETIIQ